MKEFIFLAMMLCPPTEFKNLTKEEWNSRDYFEASIATKRCPELYPNSPCLKKFVKVRPLMYRAICGRKR